VLAAVAHAAGRGRDVVLVGRPVAVVVHPVAGRVQIIHRCAALPLALGARALPVALPVLAADQRLEALPLPVARCALLVADRLVAAAGEKQHQHGQRSQEKEQRPDRGA